MNLLQMSISAGLLVFLVVLLRVFAINRLPKTMFIILWLIALCRLIIPFSIPSKFSIYNEVTNFFREIFLPKLSTSVNGFEQGSFALKEVKYMNLVFTPMHLEVLWIIWIAGALLLAGFFTVSLIKAYRELGTALPVNKNSFFDQWMGEQRLFRPLRILTSDKITTPITYGIFAPKIVLPKSLKFSNELKLHYILAHEVIHVKHFDALWKTLLVIAVCIHWFNPMVWLLYYLMNRDLEISCDEKVIRLFGEKTRSSYALSLIEMAESRAGFAPLYSSFSKNATEERILSIMKFKKTSAVSIALALILIFGASTVFAQSVSNVLRSQGVIQSSNGAYSFDIDEKGNVTVKDEEENIVSTTTVGSDGKAVLTDGSGQVISIINSSGPKAGIGGDMTIVGSGLSAPIGSQSLIPPPEYFFEVENSTIVKVRDPKGNLIGSGTIDSNGNAAISNYRGEEIGAVSINNGVVTMFSLKMNNPGQ